MPAISIGELDALVLKAYRGAGFSWGMAQEAGRAAAWLAQNGLPAAEYFDTLLRQIDGADASSITPGLAQATEDHKIPAINWHRAEPLCPVVCGTVFSDLSIVPGEDTQSGNVYSPGILLPFIADCAIDARQPIRMTVNGSSITVNSRGQLESIDAGFLLVQSGAATLTCASDNAFVPVAECRRVDSTDDALAYLNVLAHRTYVPASEQSRSSGAGAGLTDND